MKVLITTDWSESAINGVVTSVASLVDGLTALGHEVRILTLSNNRHSYQKGNVTYIGSVNVGKIYPNARLKAVPSGRYVRALVAWHPDVVHSQCEFSTFFLAEKISEACNCPLIHTYHTVYEDFTHYFSPSVRFGKYVAAVLSKRILSKTQEVIAPTQKIKKMLLGYGIETPISVIPSGLRLDQFRKQMEPVERVALREELGISATDRVLVYLGRLAREKNIEELLDLLSLWKEKSLRFLLVGDGPYRTKLENRVSELGLESQVVFAGMVSPQMTAWYYHLGDIFVSASQSETQGLTYIEAMACGLPLLCKYDPCLDEVIQDEVNGLTYRNADEFCEKLDRLLSDDMYRRNIGSEARKIALNNFSSESFAEKALRVYKKHLSR